MGASTFAARARLAALLDLDDDAPIPPLDRLVVLVEELVDQAREATSTVAPAPGPVDIGDQVLNEARAQLAAALGFDVDRLLPGWHVLVREVEGLAGLRAALLAHFQSPTHTTNSQLVQFVEAIARRRTTATRELDAIRTALRAVLGPASNDADQLARLAAQLDPRELAMPDEPGPEVVKVWTADAATGEPVGWLRDLDDGRPQGWLREAGGGHLFWPELLALGPVLLDDPRRDEHPSVPGGVPDGWDDGPAGGDPDH